ncbi:MAG: ABC transporter permease [Oligoflexus sp.]
MEAGHAFRAMKGILTRELYRYLQQKTRFFAALVRPMLWLLVFGTGFRNVLELSVLEPYGTPIPYHQYLIPGLVAMIFLFNGMQSSLSMVYDRELGVMRLLLTAPLPRWYLILGKLIASTTVSILQAYLFLLVCLFAGYLSLGLNLIIILPFFVLCGLLLAAVGLVLSIYIQQIENFAGAMNFVIFPMFFLSSALYPLSQINENSVAMYWLTMINPFTHVVELLRFGLYGQVESSALFIVMAYASLFVFVGIKGYSVSSSKVKIKQKKEPAILAALPRSHG